MRALAAALLTGGAAAVIACTAAAGADDMAAHRAGDDMAAHRADVERHSEMVMPFSMDMTKHVFSPAPDGGTQAVLVPGGDAHQIALVRSHLRKESTAFARGDYADPMAIHGATMPGLAVLAKSRGKVAVRYADLPNGARIVFRAHDERVIDALHRWFAAQVADHGAHAMMMKM